MSSQKCLICGRKLRSEESIRCGIGPVCLRAVNKVRKEMQKKKVKAKKLKGQIGMFD